MTVASVALGCGSAAPTSAEADAAGDPEVALIDCSGFSSWGDAQIALDAGTDQVVDLDEDSDGIACNELADQEYAEGWSEAYPEACTAVFEQSYSGSLFDGTGAAYTETDCELADPGPGAWEGDVLGEPVDDGRADAWIAACETFFGEVVGDDLREHGDDVYLTEDDCALESPY